MRHWLQLVPCGWPLIDWLFDTHSTCVGTLCYSMVGIVLKIFAIITVLDNVWLIQFYYIYSIIHRWYCMLLGSSYIMVLSVWSIFIVEFTLRTSRWTERYSVYWLVYYPDKSLSLAAAVSFIKHWDGRKLNQISTYMYIGYVFWFSYLPSFNTVLYHTIPPSLVVLDLGGKRKIRHLCQVAKLSFLFPSNHAFCPSYFLLWHRLLAVYHADL